MAVGVAPAMRPIITPSTSDVMIQGSKNLIADSSAASQAGYRTNPARATLLSECSVQEPLVEPTSGLFAEYSDSHDGLRLSTSGDETTNS